MEEKRPFSVKHGLNHVTYLIEQVRGVVEQVGGRIEQIRRVVHRDVRDIHFVGVPLDITSRTSSVGYLVMYSKRLYHNAGSARRVRRS